MSFFISIQNQWVVAFVLNFVLIYLAQRFPFLTASGWVHAGGLGTILWACLGLKGWSTVVIYLALGTLVTKIGFNYKQTRGIAEARGGRRGPANVWGSAATGAFLAFLVGIGFGPKELLVIGFAASFAAKLADTFGSEIGKRWGRKAFLITTLHPVSPGTEGAISIEGTLASALGSFVMTVVVFSLSLVDDFLSLLIIFVSGLLATLLESFVGAVFQNRIAWLSNELVNFFQTNLSALLAITVSFFII